MANLDGFDKALGLDEIEGELIANGGTGSMLEEPCLLVHISRVPVGSFLLADGTQCLPGAATTQVVLQAALRRQWLCALQSTTERPVAETRQKSELDGITMR